MAHKNFAQGKKILFCEKYSDRVRDRYLLYTKDLSKDGALQMVPIYMAPFL